MQITDSDGVTYGFSKFPDRKKYSLYRWEGTTITRIASFKDREDAYQFFLWIHRLATSPVNVVDDLGPTTVWEDFKSKLP